MCNLKKPLADPPEADGSYGGSLMGSKSTPAPHVITCLLCVAAVLACVFAWVVGLIQVDRVDPSAGIANLSSLTGYWIIGAAAWGVLSVIAWRLSCDKRRIAASQWAGAAVIVLVALAARIVAVLAGGPQLSDDLWRYIHDGRQLASGVSPYYQSPQELGAGQGQDPILDRVNHPELVTIYQPTSQYIFAALWRLRPQQLDPLGVNTFRFGFVLIDLMLIVLLIIQLQRDGRSVWWATLYAWHPLAISEVAASGHQDVIGITLLVAGLMLFQTRSMAWRHALLGGAAFAAAVAVKPIVLPLAIPIVWRLRSSLRGVAVAGGGAVFALCALYLPFVFLDGGLSRMFETIGSFVGQWSFNSSLHAAAVYATGSKTIAGVLMAGLLITVLIGGMALRWGLWRVACVYLFAALLLSSTVYPWYLLWALAFVSIRFGLGVWVFSLTITWSYAVLGNAVAWELPVWVVVVEYTSVYAAVIWALTVVWRSVLRGGAADISGPRLNSP